MQAQRYDSYQLMGTLVVDVYVGFFYYRGTRTAVLDVYDDFFIYSHICSACHHLLRFIRYLKNDLSTVSPTVCWGLKSLGSEEEHLHEKKLLCHEKNPVTRSVFHRKKPTKHIKEKKKKKIKQSYTVKGKRNMFSKSRERWTFKETLRLLFDKLTIAKGKLLIIHK